MCEPCKRDCFSKDLEAMSSERDHYRAVLESIRDTWFRHLSPMESCLNKDIINAALSRYPKSEKGT